MMRKSIVNKIQVKFPILKSLNRVIMAKENNPIAYSCLKEDDLIVVTGAGDL
jgi:hypothetical protein